MKNIVIVVTDLGNFKAYKLEKTNLNTPRLELMRQDPPVNGHNRIVEKVSDQAGRYHNRANGKWATPWGEPHNIELEDRKRRVRHVAHELDSILRNDDVDGCWLAASKEINHQVLAELDPQSRAKILKNIPADLTRTDKSQLLNHFA
jgi:Protein required for attachment to host cells